MRATRDAPPDDGPTELLEWLVTSGRFEMAWGRSTAKWVSLTDLTTGTKAIGRDHQSWDAAAAKALHAMRLRLARR